MESRLGSFPSQPPPAPLQLPDIDPLVSRTMTIFRFSSALDA
jgi:hypothetical protein